MNKNCYNCENQKTETKIIMGGSGKYITSKALQTVYTCIITGERTPRKDIKKSKHCKDWYLRESLIENQLERVIYGKAL